MKMTMHIDEDVLAQVMELTGAKTKTQAVEMALTEMARRHRQKKFFQKGLGLTPEQLGEYGRALMEIHGDSMDIDEAAVQRFIAKSDARRAAKQARELKVAEDQQVVRPVRHDLPPQDPLPEIKYPKAPANEQPGSR
jgi:hypothetical protein